MLTAQNIYLRTLESIDVDQILRWENNKENWEISGTTEPFTRKEIEQFVNSEHNIEVNLQIRYVICKNTNDEAIGTIDLFELNPKDQCVGVGVLIAESVNRNKGYASEALKLVIDYCRNELNVVYVFCNILQNNLSSIRLFEKLGFEFIEERKLYGNSVNYYELIL